MKDFTNHTDAPIKIYVKLGNQSIYAVMLLKFVLTKTEFGYILCYCYNSSISATAIVIKILCCIIYLGATEDGNMKCESNQLP